MVNIYNEENEYGKISVSESVITDIIISEMAKYNGKIWITNNKGKSVSKLYRSVGGSPAGNIQIDTRRDGRLEIKLNIVLKFGMSIKKTTEEIMENIRKQIKIATGENPAKLTLVITGVLSKKLARRNIEIERKYDIN